MHHDVMTWRLVPKNSTSYYSVYNNLQGSKRLNTVTIWISLSSIQMVQSSPVVKWSGFQMVVWKMAKKIFFMVKISRFWMVCLITWSDHLKTRHKSISDFRCSVFRWLLYREFSVPTHQLRCDVSLSTMRRTSCSNLFNHRVVLDLFHMRKIGW